MSQLDTTQVQEGRDLEGTENQTVYHIISEITAPGTVTKVFGEDEFYVQDIASNVHSRPYKEGFNVFRAFESGLKSVRPTFISNSGAPRSITIKTNVPENQLPPAVLDYIRAR